MMDEMIAGALPGYRLNKVQVMNWGTLDSTRGQVHTVRPEGRTSLLIGQNGSGKSTMVDSILTLLVRPGVRNYNVAAGSTGRKRERDERSYYLGAYGHASSTGDNKASTLYLRKEGKHLSILLAYFHNAGNGKGFTIAQVLYGGIEGKVEKIYCFARGEKDIAEHFSKIKSVDQIGSRLSDQGIKTTKTFLQYQKWILSETNMRPKAMDVFNQTVAVKDIRSLTEFIRAHMLESTDWRERIDDILNHFQQLSDAHRLLVDSREQYEALQPIVASGADYQSLRTELEKRERIERSCDCFFRVRTIELFGTLKTEREAEFGRLTGEVEKLGRQVDEADDELRRIKNDMENAGGERLRTLPFLIQRKEEESQKRRAHCERYRKALAQGGIDSALDSEEAFAEAQRALDDARGRVEAELNGLGERKLDQAVRSHELDRKRQDLEKELEALTQRSSNLPEPLLEMRRRLCQTLGLEHDVLPFAAELMAVKDDAVEWQSAAEMVLRPFGLSLLVPADSYREVSRYLDETPLMDLGGRGLRLVYYRVGTPVEEALAGWSDVGERSLLMKLRLREDNPLTPWLKAELVQRFDFRCCEDIEAFQEQRAMALTKDRHVRFNPSRHEKDDRASVADPRRFILGWDNAVKIEMLREDLAGVAMRLQQAVLEAGELEEREGSLRRVLDAMGKALDVQSFVEIDHGAVDREVSDLLREKQSLESSDQAVSAMASGFKAAQERKEALKRAEAEAIKRVGVLESEIAQASEWIQAAEERLSAVRAAGEMEAHEAYFPVIVEDLQRQGLEVSAEALFEQENAYLGRLRSEIQQVRRKLEPVEKALHQSMGRFLRKFRHMEHELQDDPAYLGDFIRLHDRLEQEDLPRHEDRFKERLNEKVTTELGLLNNQLNNEREEILNRIETLNKCLETIDYDPVHASFMQLEPKVVKDKEIEEFQSIMKECLSDVFDGRSFEADEARFKRIESMIARLRDEPRWREKVTDVRRWFDFGARETVRATGEERGYYSDSMGQSGGEKAKLAFTILVAAVVYQFDIDPEAEVSDRFHFVVVDEMFSKIDDHYAEYAMRLFQKFGLQLLIVAPFDAKAKVTEPFVDYYMHVVKKNNRSRVLTMTSREFHERSQGRGGTAEEGEEAGTPREATVVASATTPPPPPPPVPGGLRRPGDAASLSS